MKIQKIDSCNFNKKNRNINFQSKTILTNTKIKPRMDIFKRGNNE